MKTIRVFELADRLHIDAQEPFKIAKDLEISVGNVVSKIIMPDVERIKKSLSLMSEE